jgi:hypothetical protein
MVRLALQFCDPFSSLRVGWPLVRLVLQFLVPVFQFAGRRLAGDRAGVFGARVPNVSCAGMENHLNVLGSNGKKRRGLVIENEKGLAPKAAVERPHII